MPEKEKNLVTLFRPIRTAKGFQNFKDPKSYIRFFLFELSQIHNLASSNSKTTRTDSQKSIITTVFRHAREILLQGLDCILKA